MREGSPKPVQFPDHEGVARAEGTKGCIETAARGHAAAYTLVREDALASRGLEGVTLQGEILVDGRDARIADQHPVRWDKITGHASY